MYKQVLRAKHPEKCSCYHCMANFNLEAGLAEAVRVEEENKRWKKELRQQKVLWALSRSGQNEADDACHRVRFHDLHDPVGRIKQALSGNEVDDKKLRIGDSVICSRSLCGGKYKLLGIFEAWAWIGHIVHTTWQWHIVTLEELKPEQEASHVES